jgi:hypothetical protein
MKTNGIHRWKSRTIRHFPKILAPPTKQSTDLKIHEKSRDFPVDTHKPAP